MLENINILGRYDAVAKTSGQLEMFLEEMRTQLEELEIQDGITVEDEFALCEWDYVLEEIYNKYRSLVNDEVLFMSLGLCHVLRKRCSADGIYKIEGTNNAK